MARHSHSRQSRRHQCAAARRFPRISARRNLSSRSNATWTASPRSSVSLPSNSAAAIFFNPARPPRPARSFAKKSIWANSSIALSSSPDYRAKKELFAKENPRSRRKKGIGIAAFLHGAGFTGSGERYLSSVVGVEACADGGLSILVSSTEFGQGTNTVLCQIAAEALGLRYEDVYIAQPDTHKVPNSGPTVASRTAMVVGKLVQSAALGIKKTLTAAGLLADSYTPEEFRAACRALRREARNVSQFRPVRAARRHFLGR